MRTVRLLAVFLGILGVASVMMVATALPASAQTGDYETKWEATDLIVARLKSVRWAENQNDCTNWPFYNLGNPPNSEVVIGVAKWTVKGEIFGSTRYKELWSVPELPTAFTFTGDFINGRCQNGRLAVQGNSDQTDWLYGWLVIENLIGRLGIPAMQIRTAGINETLTTLNNQDSRVPNIGKATSCHGNDSGLCIFTSGPYSWTTHHRIMSAGDAKHYNLGTLMPLKWSVTGYICEPGDNRCN